MPNDGAVPGEAQFTMEAGSLSWVFNGRVSWLMCTWVVKRLTGNFGSKLRFSVGLTSVKRRFNVNIPIQTLIFSP